MRAAFVLASVAAATLAAAAPVPKVPSEAERIEKLFGKPVDPNKDCKFRLDGAKLVVAIPDKPHDFNLDSTTDLFNAPRTERGVTGGFSARVKVKCQLAAAANIPAKPKGETCFAARLVAWQDEKNYAYVQVVRAIDGQLRTVTGRVQCRGQVSNAGGVSQVVDGTADPTVAIWLRMTYGQGEFRGWYSYDSVSWASAGGSEYHPTGETKLGVIAAHTGTAGFTATFEDFTVEPLTDTMK